MTVSLSFCLSCRADSRELEWICGGGNLLCLLFAQHSEEVYDIVYFVELYGCVHAAKRISYQYFLNTPEKTENVLKQRKHLLESRNKFLLQSNTK